MSGIATLVNTLESRIGPILNGWPSAAGLQAVQFASGPEFTIYGTLGVSRTRFMTDGAPLGMELLMTDIGEGFGASHISVLLTVGEYVTSQERLLRRGMLLVRGTSLCQGRVWPPST